MDLIGRDFLTLLDFTPAEIGSLLDLAAELKAKKKAGIPHDTLRGKNVALIFEKTQKLRLPINTSAPRDAASSSAAAVHLRTEAWRNPAARPQAHSTMAVMPRQRKASNPMVSPGLDQMQAAQSQTSTAGSKA